MEDEDASFDWSVMVKSREDSIDIVECGDLEGSHSHVKRDSSRESFGVWRWKKKKVEL